MTVRSHTHRWEADPEGPIFEDRAAIFHERCTWVEVVSSSYSERHDERFYEYGAECEATRSYRFDVSYVWLPNGEGHPVSHSDNGLTARVEDAMKTVEEAVQDDEATILGVDPDPEIGEVRVEYDGFTVLYEP